MGRLRRLAGIVARDFGFRRRAARRPPAAPPVSLVAPIVDIPPAVAAPVPTPVPDGLPPGIVWHGSAARRPELQRFCDHLARLREGVTEERA